MEPEKMPKLPVIFQKPASALSGPADPIVRPVECAQFDYEAELAIVIGKGGRRIPADRAAGHIAGYMITNDVSARDLGEGESKRLNAAPLFQLMRMKGWDTFLPTGYHRRNRELRGHPDPDLGERRATPGLPRQGDGDQSRREGVAPPRRGEQRHGVAVGPPGRWPGFLALATVSGRACPARACPVP
ncbi:MAG: fumarylacetoacetate hydrolase family protein [Amycolatopsis sp.]|nr:fumarylacetoacetate hydrolase family protein [Amycolatopsis sp.]